MKIKIFLYKNKKNIKNKNLDRGGKSLIYSDIIKNKTCENAQNSENEFKFKNRRYQNKDDLSKSNMNNRDS